MSAFKQLDSYAQYLRKLESEQHADDIRKAANLRRSRSIANVKPGAGPRIAR